MLRGGLRQKASSATLPETPPLPSLLSPPSSQLGGLGSTVSSPSGVWGEAPAEIEFGAFYLKSDI